MCAAASSPFRFAFCVSFLCRSITHWGTTYAFHIKKSPMRWSTANRHVRLGDSSGVLSTGKTCRPSTTPYKACPNSRQIKTPLIKTNNVQHFMKCTLPLWQAPTDLLLLLPVTQAAGGTA